jgi:hypothetical protein
MPAVSGGHSTLTFINWLQLKQSLCERDPLFKGQAGIGLASLQQRPPTEPRALTDFFLATRRDGAVSLKPYIPSDRDLAISICFNCPQIHRL